MWTKPKISERERVTSKKIACSQRLKRKNCTYPDCSSKGKEKKRKKPVIYDLLWKILSLEGDRKNMSKKEASVISYRITELTTLEKTSEITSTNTTVSTRPGH